MTVTVLWWAVRVHVNFVAAEAVFTPSAKVATALAAASMRAIHLCIETSFELSQVTFRGPDEHTKD
jgi:hypothetical protein